MLSMQHPRMPWPREWSVRNSIVEACRKMNALGINQGTSGNISVRWKDGLLISPSGVDYADLTADDVVFIRYDGSYEGSGETVLRMALPCRDHRAEARGRVGRAHPRHLLHHAGDPGHEHPGGALHGRRGRRHRTFPACPMSPSAPASSPISWSTALAEPIRMPARQPRDDRHRPGPAAGALAGGRGGDAGAAVLQLAPHRRAERPERRSDRRDPAPVRELRPAALAGPSGRQGIDAPEEARAAGAGARAVPRPTRASAWRASRTASRSPRRPSGATSTSSRPAGCWRAPTAAPWPRR